MSLNYRLLGDKIKNLRQNKGLTQEALAEKTNLTAPYIGQIERGERKLSVETLVQIGNALGASFDYLLQIDPRAKHDSVLDELAAAFKGRTYNEIKMIIDVGKTIFKHCKIK